MSSRYKLILKILLPFLFALYALAFSNILTAYGKLPVAETEWFAPETKYLKLITFGFNHLMADLLLIDTQFFVADNKNVFTEKRCRMLKYKMDMITKLDPESEYAYIYGGYALPEYCDLMGIADSNDLLKRGWSALPDNFKMPKMIGFNFVRYSEEPERGAKWLRIASRLPKAPTNLIWVADALVRKNPENYGMLEIQQKIMCDMCETVTDKDQKKHLCTHCAMYGDIVGLNKVANEFEKKEGYRITNIQELADRHYIKYVPKDPSGGKYIVLENGVIDSTINARKEFDESSRRQ